MPSYDRYDKKWKNPASGTKVWAHDAVTFLKGSSLPFVLHVSSWYDPSFGVDLDDQGTVNWIEAFLRSLGMNMAACAAYFEVVRAHGGTKKPNGWLCDVLYKLALYRNPGYEDRKSEFFHHVLKKKWKSLAVVNAELEQANEAKQTLEQLTSKPTVVSAFSADELTLLNELIGKWRQYLPMQDDNQLAAYILSFGSKDADREDLAEKLLLVLIGYRTRRLAVEYGGKFAGNPNLRLLSKLQEAVLAGQILTNSKYHAPAGEEKIWSYSKTSLQSVARARLDLLVAWQRVRKMGVACGFPIMRWDIRRIMSGKKALNITFFSRISALLLPDATSAQRDQLNRAIKEWIVSEELGISTVTQWTARNDALLLKQCIEIGNREQTGIAIAIRRYSIYLPVSAAPQRVLLLLKQKGLPALALLKRSCPNWWRGMLLGDDFAAALSILAHESNRSIETEETVKIVYEGKITELAEEDAAYSDWLPKAQMKGDDLDKYIEYDAFKHVRAITKNQLLKIDQTRLAVYKRHINSDYVDDVFANL